MLGKLYTRNSQSKLFKARVYQGRGHPLKNLGRGDQYYNNKNRIRFCDKGRSYDRNRSHNR